MVQPGQNVVVAISPDAKKTGLVTQVNPMTGTCVVKVKGFKEIIVPVKESYKPLKGATKHERVIELIADGIAGDYERRGVVDVIPDERGFTVVFSNKANIKHMRTIASEINRSVVSISHVSRIGPREYYFQIDRMQE